MRTGRNGSARRLGGQTNAAGDAVAALIAGLGLPGTLRDVGVKAEQLDEIAAGSMHDRWVHTNPAQDRRAAGGARAAGRRLVNALASPGRIRMTYLAPNSVQARDIASIVHPQTNLARHLEEGPMVIGSGQGCFVYDDNGNAVSRYRGRAVVRLARLCLGTAGESRVRADAQARLLPSVPRHDARDRGRSGGETAVHRAGADEQGAVPVLRVGGERYGAQAGLVLPRTRSASRRSARSSAGRWRITAAPRPRSARRASRTCTPISACRSRASCTPNIRTTTATTPRANRRNSSPRAWPTRWKH